jgi:hypothetical protein
MKEVKNHKPEVLNTELDKLIADIEKYKINNNQYSLSRDDLKEISRFKDKPHLRNLLIKCYQR